ncbi:FG-GAP repeat domain-containing protein [Candidatus Thiosymbion oneisti]|uniref:FG-GAP repeat domain-containing protein n=1 Tax=Candidatus Thiosymbion oneisti TaxID=589554 RepID=UPI000B0D0749|nr:VCBS repeat-containing protein [Candidatus Thiosymbion oneisti]
MLRVEPTAEFGIDFVHETGAAGDKLMPETMGPGCALFDYDGDGRLDALFTDGRPWNDRSRRPIARLYRNEGERFREVTSDAGLDSILGYGMGVAVADYDADGDSDLVVTTVTGTRLLRNDASVLVDVTAATGLEYGVPEWATSAAWLDVDQDGWLDLFVAHYVQWSPETDIFTTLDGTNKSYATPQVYGGLDNRLFRNLGNGRFADISAEAGLVSGENKALGVVVLDVNDDRFPDLFVSNDTVANKLYVNDGKSLADLTGAPVSEAVVGRCVALGDMDKDGDLDGLVSVNDGSPLILRNETGGTRAVRIDLRDPNSGNLEALGAEVVLSGNGWSRSETVRARGSYLGHSPYTLEAV